MTGVDRWLLSFDKEVFRFFDMIGECWVFVLDSDRPLEVCWLCVDISGWIWVDNTCFEAVDRPTLLLFLLVDLDPCCGTYRGSRWWYGFSKRVCAPSSKPAVSSWFRRWIAAYKYGLWFPYLRYKYLDSHSYIYDLRGSTPEYRARELVKMVIKMSGR